MLQPTVVTRSFASQDYAQLFPPAGRPHRISPHIITAPTHACARRPTDPTHVPFPPPCKLYETSIVLRPVVNITFSLSRCLSIPFVKSELSHRCWTYLPFASDPPPPQSVSIPVNEATKVFQAHDIQLGKALKRPLLSCSTRLWCNRSNISPSQVTLSGPVLVARRPGERKCAITSRFL